MSKAKQETRAPVADHIEIHVDGEERDIFMSFGLLNELTKMIEEPARIPVMALEPELRTRVLSSLLAKRKKSGKIQEEVEDIDDVDISIEDVERLLEWAAKHLLNFYTRSLQKVVAATEMYESEIKALVPFLGGSPD